MKKNSLFILLLFIVSCNNKTDKNLEIAEKYFEFDKVEHFQVNNNDEVWKLLKTPESERTIEGKYFHKILMEYNYPKSVNDSAFFIKLTKLYPKINIVDSTLYKSLSKIFSNHKIELKESNACDAFYWDIFIFKKNGKVNGIAKICFDCNLQYIVGSKTNTANFGANGEFEELKKLIIK